MRGKIHYLDLTNRRRVAMTSISEVPTREEILDALQLPEVEEPLDRMGRTMRKNWTSVSKRPKDE